MKNNAIVAVTAATAMSNLTKNVAVKNPQLKGFL
jgi:hypothetical protein